MKQKEILVLGSGMGSLTAAALLCHAGHRVKVLEQNYLPGGCTSAYYRQGYIFEAGATTVVGMDEAMPLRALCQILNLDLGLVKLETPMRVHLSDGRSLTRHQDLNQWISEAEKTFGPKGQKGFWEECYALSDFVWRTSMKHQSFPPTRLRDVWAMLPHLRWEQFRRLPWAFRSMRDLLAKHGLDKHEDFLAFVDEQLLITAQNQHQEVNALFGATALCYTQYGNYYLPGGLIWLVRPLVDYIEQRGGEVHLKRSVTGLERLAKGRYRAETSNGPIEGDILLSGLPINDTLRLWKNESQAQVLNKKYKHRILDSESLNSAFQMGLGLAKIADQGVLHHQIHLPQALEGLGSRSIFLSLSHQDDVFRAERGRRVASISTHLPNPLKHWEAEREPWEKTIIETLVQRGFIAEKDILYRHSSAAASWQRWTGRYAGFVGGYPQYLRIKPWQLLDARLDGFAAYLCGDTAYPGQGIPGVCLGGFIAVRKMALDGHL